MRDRARLNLVGRKRAPALLTKISDFQAPGLYDPSDPNDRLVLGLKGTLFAAELHIIQARTRGGLLNKARRGALAQRLPVGYRRLAGGSGISSRIGSVFLDSSSPASTSSCRLRVLVEDRQLEGARRQSKPVHIQ